MNDPPEGGTEDGSDPRPGGKQVERARKSPGAFRTISEVADELHVPQHVLRFWETKFVQVRPLKRGGGRRYYRPEDIALLRRISDLLYIQGYTIKGVQRLLREGGGTLSDDIPPPAGEERAAPGTEPEATTATGPWEPELPFVPDASAAEADAARLRALLRDVLAELESLRALLP